MLANHAVIPNEVLEQIIQDVFQTMLEIELFPSDVELAKDCLVATIRIVGAWNGTVSLALSLDLARNAASQMLKLPADDVTTLDEHEVAAELANMIGGNFKSLLAGPSQLSLPSIDATPRIMPFNQAVTLTAPEGGLRLAVSATAA